MSKNKANLKSLVEAVEKIENFVKEVNSADEFFQLTEKFDAVLMNFIVIGEMVDRLPENFKENNSQVDWRKIKGFRNIIAHDYLGVDAEEVWQIITNHLSNLKIKIQEILNNLNLKT